MATLDFSKAENRRECNEKSINKPRIKRTGNFQVGCAYGMLSISNHWNVLSSKLSMLESLSTGIKLYPNLAVGSNVMRDGFKSPTKTLKTCLHAYEDEQYL